MPKPAKTSEPDLPTLSPLELNRIARLPEASRLSGVSEDSIRRNHSDKLIRLGPRAVGIRVGHCLHLLE
jgi:hypothetical protein